MNLTPQETLQAMIDDKKLEFRPADGLVWRAFHPDNSIIFIRSIFNGCFVFRLDQEMITIDDVSFPKPESEYEKFEEGQEYFMPALQSDAFYCHSKWWHGTLDTKRLKQGIIHLTKENAIAHAKALIKLSGGNVDE